MKKFSLLCVSTLIWLLCLEGHAQTSTPPVVSIVAATPETTENGAVPGVFTIAWAPPSNTVPVYLTRDLRVFYRITGLAQNGIDYERITNYVVIPLGSQAATISIQPIDDRLSEGRETVTLEIVPTPLSSGPPYMIGSPRSATVTVLDNEEAPTNFPPAISLIMPTNQSTFPAPADIGLLAQAQDRDGFVDTVEFFAGSRSLGTVTNNPYVMSPINPWRLLWTNVGVGDYVLTAVATDNVGTLATSAPVRISVFEALPPQTVVNIRSVDLYGAEIPVVPPELDILQRYDPAVLRVTRSGSVDFPLTVFYSIGGSAENGVDYTSLSRLLTIPVGASSADIVIDPIDDDLIERTENVVITIEPPICIDIYPPPPECYRVGESSRGVAYILDDEVATNLPPVVSIAARDASAAEAGSDTATFIISRSGSTDLSLTVFYSVTGSAENGVDYTRISESVTIPVGTSSAAIVIEPIDDKLIERMESVMLTIEAPGCIAIYPPPPGCYTVGQNSRAMAYILDDELAPKVTIAATDANASETGPDAGAFTVTRTGSTEAALRVYYYAGGSAQNGIDYAKMLNYVEIPAGSASADIVVTPIDDSLVERAETVAVQLRLPMLPISDTTTRDMLYFTNTIIAPAPYVIGSPSSAFLTIADNDTDGTNVPPVVRMVRPADGSVFRAGANIGLLAEARDLDGSIATVEFFAGEKSLGFGILAPMNSYPGEHYFLMWSNAPAGRFMLTAKATDNEDAAAWSRGVQVSIIETNLPPEPTVPVVTIAAVDSTASEGRFDYPTTVIIESNVLRTTITGMSNTDWIQMDPTNVVRWTNIYCGTNTAAFQVRRYGPTNADLTVFYSIAGTASNGIDYVELPGSVTIPAGRRGTQIVVVPIDDAVAESLESIVLTLVVPVTLDASILPTYSIGTPGRAAAVIKDNDGPSLTPVRLRDGLFYVRLPAIDGTGFRLERSTDLLNWAPCLTSIATGSSVDYVDPDAAEADVLFYRSVPEPVLMPEE